MIYYYTKNTKTTQGCFEFRYDKKISIDGYTYLIKYEFNKVKLFCIRTKKTYTRYIKDGQFKFKNRTFWR